MSSKLPPFEDLKKLAKEHPDKLEQLRTKLVDDIIESAPEDIQRRLRGLQFQVDAQRRMHSSPTRVCVEISRMMHESLQHLNQVLNGGYEHTKPDEINECATILAFPAAG